MGPAKVLRFDTVKQSKQYDARGVYIKKWVEELREVPEQEIHDPYEVGMKTDQ